jgi:hypothetical protein
VIILGENSEIVLNGLRIIVVFHQQLVRGPGPGRSIPGTPAGESWCRVQRNARWGSAFLTDPVLEADAAHLEFRDERLDVVIVIRALRRIDQDGSRC